MAAMGKARIRVRGSQVQIWVGGQGQAGSISDTLAVMAAIGKAGMRIRWRQVQS